MTLATDLATRAQTLGQQVLAGLSAQYENGVFWNWDMTNYHRAGFPHAALMATLMRGSGISAALKADYLAKITEIVEFGLATNMTTAQDAFTDGAADPFGYYGQYPDAQAMKGQLIPGPNTTIEQINDLGWILWQLPQGSIDSATRRRWTKVVQDCASRLDNWFDGNKITTYYINGNFNCQLLGVYWMAAMASSGAKKLYYVDCYERAYNFLVKPALSSATWTGWGLTVDVAGVAPDWSDYQVHLTETNTRVLPPDFDWNYSVVQMDALARVFVCNRDSRVIRIINGISNKVAPRWNPATWVLDGTGGSRTTNMQGYINCYFEVQALMSYKGYSTTNLTPVATLARWDGAFAPNMLTDISTGYYVLSALLSRALAVVRAAAEIVANETSAAA